MYADRLHTLLSSLYQFNKGLIASTLKRWHKLNSKKDEKFSFGSGRRGL